MSRSNRSSMQSLMDGLKSKLAASRKRIISPVWHTIVRQRKKIIPYVLLFVPLLYLTIFYFVPLAISLLYSVGAINRFYRLVPVFTFEYYLDSLKYNFIPIFWRSLLIAGLTTLMCFLLGYPVAYTIALKTRRFRGVLMMLVILPYWVSFLLRIYALMSILEFLDMQFFEKLGMPIMHSIWAVMLGMFYDYVPFMILPLYASIEKLDVSVLEASKTLGAGSLRTFFHVTLPMTAPGVAAGALLVFVPSVGEFLIPSLLGGPSNFMLGNLVWDMFMEVRDPWLGSAVSTVMLIIVLAIVLIYMKYGGGEIAF
jgi:spermidine/putrescine transport system permease protein